MLIAGAFNTAEQCRTAPPLTSWCIHFPSSDLIAITLVTTITVITPITIIIAINSKNSDRGVLVSGGLHICRAVECHGPARRSMMSDTNKWLGQFPVAQRLGESRWQTTQCCPCDHRANAALRNL
eukprot:gnl/TRDRNA2_/TRDRNA2_145149_c2_seq1.p1 gnl/TRDRNA2_/TRDRNA2_145149_c2~~gnl/TRDRNA2_/TRDRNA2_145149_c2_seq1.p1  ORF type:complete len:125 (-),score=3.48 gnl/TRDRNA2_/TRDRNA2_145149_c2_seq1:40-414(-)